MWTGADLVEDVSEGDWIEPAISGFYASGGGRFGMVGALLPPCFDAYARILHPAYRFRSGVRSSPLVCWTTVAAANGRTMHPLVQWTHLLPHRDEWEGQTGVWAKGPDTGRLEPPVRKKLESILAAHTSTPDTCWYAIWEGNTILDDVRHLGGRVRAYGLEFFLVKDELQAPDDERDLDSIPAGLWWPNDRSWCVSSNGDLMSTYVGGTYECIAAILDDPDLEAFPVAPTDDVTSTSDTVNPLPPLNGSA
ncbi:hypothetical protein [Rhodococcus sp. NPDC058521]|uniref:hypothetical protein n=1 Tax=Rhodococcus sp. NPDC058521 TaxID=3346536 RepID=UPI0036672906